MIDSSSELEALLDDWRAQLGRDYPAYRNHLYRLLNLVHARLRLDAAQQHDLAVACVFHDLGIWSDDTFDYLSPSRARALQHCAANDANARPQRIADLIEWHHKLTPFRGPDAVLVNAFRRADWYEVVCGLFGRWSWRAQRRAIYRRFPTTGFHGVLLRLGWRRLRTHPLSPLPMLRW